MLITSVLDVSGFVVSICYETMIMFIKIVFFIHPNFVLHVNFENLV